MNDPPAQKPKPLTEEENGCCNCGDVTLPKTAAAHKEIEAGSVL